ncbi:MAG: hypothetical protein M1114_05520 [Candidatus Dependentiae bacterium]|nr:hypothetical protein [Candidatus Dependentiae bacterium]
MKQVYTSIIFLVFNLLIINKSFSSDWSIVLTFSSEHATSSLGRFMASKIYKEYTAGDLALIKKKIEAGADVNQLFQIAPYKAYTPLAMAVRSNSPEVAKELIIAGADVNNDTNSGMGHKGSRAIDFCDDLFWENTLPIFEILLQEGTDINQQDQYGNTVLHRIILHGSTETMALKLKIALLMQYGANSNVKNFKGQTAFELLKEEKQHLDAEAIAQYKDLLYKSIL